MGKKLQPFKFLLLISTIGFFLSAADTLLGRTTEPLTVKSMAGFFLQVAAFHIVYQFWLPFSLPSVFRKPVGGRSVSDD